MPAARDATPTRPKVLIVCDNDETLLGLRDYLRGAGLDARATRDLAKAWRETPGVNALVVFPDDFPALAVGAGLSGALAASPGAFAVVVTGDPRAFNAIATARRQACVVMPKPVWVWSILDVLRTHWETRP